MSSWIITSLSPSLTSIFRYSEFINFPIYLYTTKEEEEEVPVEEGDDEEEEDEEERTPTHT